MSYRFMATVVAAVFLSYAGMQWYLAQRPQMVIAPLSPNPKIPSFRQVDPEEQKRTAFQGDNDEVRQGLRRAVYDTGKNLIGNPCDDDLRNQYIAAATKYARAQLSIAPCLARYTCNERNEAQLDLLQKAFKTRFDETVRDLMMEVHGSGTILEGDFGQDVVVLVATMTKDIAINPIADPAVRREWIENHRELDCRPRKRASGTPG